MRCLLDPEIACWKGRRCKRRGSERIGRLQFFYHSPSSDLPVRDMEGKQVGVRKYEPHIEKNAENYCVCCYQRTNIRPFLRRTEERYLFLCTTCKSKDLPGHYDKMFIVGYIKKARCIRRANDRVAVQGPTKLYSFRHAYPLARLRRERNFRYMRRDLTLLETKKVLDRFSGRKNIRQACLKKLARLKRSSSRTERRCR